MKETEKPASLRTLIDKSLDAKTKKAYKEALARQEEARVKLTTMLDSETAYRFCCEAAEFMSKEGIGILKTHARQGSRWAFRLLMDVMRILTQLELIRAAQRGAKDPEPLEIETQWPEDGAKA